MNGVRKENSKTLFARMARATGNNMVAIALPDLWL